MRKLVLRNSETHKVPFYDLINGERVDTGIKLEIDYPTLEQQDILDDLHNQALKPALEKALELSQGKELTDDETDKINRQCIAYIDPVKFREYKRSVIRFSLKGLEGSDIQIKLKDGIIEEETFKALIRDKEQSDLLYFSIEPEIKFTETDKKK